MIGRPSAALLALTLLAGAMPASAQDNGSAPDKQEDPNHPGTMKRAGQIVTQPARDVGIDKKKIPPVLAAAVESPYGAPAGKGCAGIRREMSDLNAVLGPDFGTGTEANTSKIGKAAEIGGTALVDSLIPFRGLVREVSGAAPADRRFAAAVSAGMARRGYLHGLAQRCGTAKAPAKKK